MMEAIVKTGPIEGEGVTAEELAEAIKAVPRIRLERKSMLEREAWKAEQFRKSALLPQQQIAARKASEKEHKERLEQAARASIDQNEIDAKVAELKKNAEEKAKKDAAREVQRKAEQKMWEEQSKEREEKRKRDGTEEAKRKEEIRASAVQTVIGQVNRVFSEADSLYVSVKNFARLKPNPAEIAQLKKALRYASVRFAEQADKW